MLLRNAIILLLYTWTTDLQVARVLKSCHATQTERGNIEELEENLKNQKVREFEKSAEQSTSAYERQNSTKLVRVYDAFGSGFRDNKAHERTQHEFDVMSQAEVSYAEEPQTFNIIEQLKLDEISDAQSELFLEQGQVKASKKKKKKKRKRKKNKRKPHGDEATVLYTQLTTKRPHYYYPKWTTTKKPKKVKYHLHKKHALKKKKKEYLHHLKEVFYPFVKFIAFFTVLNPFTFKVFLFTLISPVVFGFLGFMALSLLVKPTLHFMFDVKKHVNQIKAKKWRERKRRERWHRNRRPITIHKHYYKNVVLPQAPKTKWQPPSQPPLPHSNWPEWVRADQIDFKAKPQQPLRKEVRRPAGLRPANSHFNPLLPNVADKLEDWHYGATQLDSLRAGRPANHARLPPFRDHIRRPHTPALKPHRSPVRFSDKPSAAPLRVSAELFEPPFL